MAGRWCSATVSVPDQGDGKVRIHFPGYPKSDDVELDTNGPRVRLPINTQAQRERGKLQHSAFYTRSNC